jgi:16S rRNA (guanine527-N7)-methyltransferase
LVKVGGRAVVLKGSRIHNELVSAKEAIEILGGTTPSVIEAVLRGGVPRTIVVVPKRRPTPWGFPRRSGVPRRQPL